MAKNINFEFDIDLKLGEDRVIFHTADDLDRWLNIEKEFWAWPQGLQSDRTASLFIVAFQSRIRNLYNKYAQLKNLKEPAAFHKKKEELIITLENYYKNNQLIHSSAPQAQFVKSVIKIDSVKAAYILKYFVDWQLNTNAKPFEAAISAMLFESKINPTGSAQERVFSESLVDSQEILNQSKKILEDIHLYHRDDPGWALKSCLKKVQSKYQRLAHATQQEQMSRIDSHVSNDKMLTLFSTIKYWDKIVTEHKIWAGMLIVIVVGVFMFVGMYICKNLGKFEGAVTWQNTQFVNVAIFFLLIIFSIGVIRFFIHSISNQIRLLKDARERSNMVLTYLALLEKNTLPDGHARDLILKCLFSSVISRCVSGVDDFFYNE